MASLALLQALELLLQLPLQHRQALRPSLQPSLTSLPSSPLQPGGGGGEGRRGAARTLAWWGCELGDLAALRKDKDNPRDLGEKQSFLQVPGSCSPRLSFTSTASCQRCWEPPSPLGTTEWPHKCLPGHHRVLTAVRG